MTFPFKKHFRLGVATASTQIEGGNVDSNWQDWHEQGQIKDGSSPANANDHYRLYREDLHLMHDLGIKDYRFGIEWAKIQPQEHYFDETVLAHYRDELQLMHDLGIQPLLTFYHFSHPQWFTDQGGFTQVENIAVFLRFVKKCLTSFNGLIADYITINEPNVYAVNGYVFGEWPPGQKNILAAAKVMSILSAAHIQAYQLIHEFHGYDPEVRVSFAHHVRVFVPKNRFNPFHVLTSAINQYFFQDALTQACFLGEFKWPLRNYLKLERGEYIDVIAVNYYTRSTVSGFKDGVKEQAPKNDLGWEIYPSGLVATSQVLHDVLAREIWITENGTCDESDGFRCRYLYDHLREIMDSPLPITRYYHWTFIDNFEWIEGETARFGLIHCDFKTQQRTVKNSALFYQAMITAHGVDDTLYQRFVNDSVYREH